MVNEVCAVVIEVCVDERGVLMNEVCVEMNGLRTLEGDVYSRE